MQCLDTFLSCLFFSHYTIAKVIFKFSVLPSVVFKKTNVFSLYLAIYAVLSIIS